MVNLKQRAILFSLLIGGVLGGITYLVVNFLDEWTRDIVDGKKVLTEVVLEKLDKAAEAAIDSFAVEGYFATDSVGKNKIDKLDGRLKAITATELKHAPGVEGGFFFPNLNQFYGFAFPTSPPPVPEFGPPPRSYNIIKKQVLQSITTDSLLINLHKFDPAVFPLATKPIYFRGKIIGAVWTRVHIERELPQIKLTDVYMMGAILFAAGFIVVLFFTLRMRNNMAKLKNGLLALESNTSYRFGAMPGVFGFIAAAINRLVTRLTELNNQKQLLERELYQQDKMATLGKLIAGVAHEVKTPLAIIKTRIQMWQRAMKNGNGHDGGTELITDDSMQLVIREIDRLSKLVKRLLVFTKPVADQFQPVNLNKLIAQTLSLIKAEEEGRISVHSQLDSAMPLTQCDPNAMEQVLINVITNAVEAIAHEGEITIASVFSQEQDTITISITDSGSGIQPEAAAKLFDPFFTTKINGVGLGLSIANEVVKAHGGNIAFAPNSPHGTICTVTIPRKK